MLRVVKRHFTKTDKDEFVAIYHTYVKRHIELLPAKSPDADIAVRRLRAMLSWRRVSAKDNQLGRMLRGIAAAAAAAA